MKQIKNKKAFYSTKWLTYTAVMTALVIATSAIPPITIPPLTGGIYWCDGVIFIAAYLLDPVASFVVGGVGTLLYDLWLGKPATMLVSLIIHGVQAASVSALLHIVFKKVKDKREPLWAGISSVVGAIAVIAGYFLFYWVIAPLVMHDGKEYGLMYAAVRIPRNIIQEVIGVALAMAVCYATTFKKQLEKNNLLPNFGREIIERNSEPEQGDDNKSPAD